MSQLSEKLKQIKNRVAAGDLNEAIEGLKELTETHESLKKYNSDVSVLSSNYEKAQRASRLGILSTSENMQMNAKIAYSIVEIADQMEKRSSSEVNIIGNNNQVFQNVNNLNLENKAEDKKTAKKRILFLGADPADADDNLRLELEIKVIEEEIAKSSQRDQFDFEKCLAVSKSDFMDKMVNYKPHILHFSGHGTSQEGFLFLGDKNDFQASADKDGLADLIGSFYREDKCLECIIFNACYSADQAEIIRQKTPTLPIIGMKNKVENEAAKQFSKNFYKALCSGRSISFSFELAKIALKVYKLPSQEEPILLA